MKTYLYKKVNAFTSENSKGNPASYLYLGKDTLSDEEMLGVGKEHAGFVSEVVFCSDSQNADVKLIYYSSECEVDFCGHGTIAAMYDLIKNNKKYCDKKELIIETNKKGFLTVFNSIDDEDAIYITAPKAEYLTLPVTRSEVAKAMSMSEDIIYNRYQMDFIDAGLRTLIVPISSLDAEVSLYPNEACLKEFCLDNGIDIILIFTMTTASEHHIAHARVFAPKFGYLEDPATGSGNSAFGYYMLKHGLWNGSYTSIEQGGDRFPYNTVKIKKLEEYILFGGKAMVRIEGKYYI